MTLINDNIQIRDYLRILMRRKWYFIFVFVFILSAGIYKILTRTPIYESYCLIKINPIDPSRLSSSLKRVVPGVTDNNVYRSLAPQMLYSQYLTQLIDSLNLRQNEQIRASAAEIQNSHPDHPLDEVIDLLLIRRLKKMIKVRIHRINTIEVSAETFSPDFSFQLVNTLTNIFMEEFIQREVAMVKSTMDFNYDQIASFRKNLEESEKKLNAYRRKNIMDEEGHEILSIEASDRINEAIVAIDLTMKGKRDYLNYVNVKLNMQETTADYPKTPLVQNTLQEIDIKIDQMGALIIRYVWNSPELVKVNRNINILREFIKSEIERFYKEKFSNIITQTLNLLLDRAITLVDLEIANRKKIVLRNILDSSKFNVSEIQNRQTELAMLEQEVAINQSLYNLFLEQSKGIQIEEAIQHAHASNRFQILEPPLKPIEPSNMSIPVLVVGILILALGAGAATVYLREFLEKSIRTVEDAEKYFNIPVLGVIPYLDNEPLIKPYKKKVISKKEEKLGKTT